jgi:hypothetical protein
MVERHEEIHIHFCMTQTQNIDICFRHPRSFGSTDRQGVLSLVTDVMAFFWTSRITLVIQRLHNLSSGRRLESRRWGTTGVETGRRELSASGEASWRREVSREARGGSLKMVRDSMSISESGELTTTTTGAWETRSTARETGEARRGSSTNTSSRTLVTVSIQTRSSRE